MNREQSIGNRKQRINGRAYRAEIAKYQIENIEQRKEQRIENWEQITGNRNKEQRPETEKI